MSHLLRTSVVLVSFGAAFTNVARADSVDDYFRGRTISISIVAAGGLYGLNAELLSRHMPRHIPGRPTLVMKTRPGAGGLNNLNILANADARDGSTMALVHKDLALFQLIEAKGVKYDARTLNWVGSVHPMYTAMLFWHGAPATTIEGLKKVEVVMGASGANHPTSMFPNFLNRQIGTKLKVVLGYRGAADIFVAIERGEAHGTSIAWDFVRSNKEAWIRDNKIIPLVQLSVDKARDLPTVPLLTELMPNEDAKRMARSLVAGSKIGMALALPPDVPSERVAALRKAFAATMNDPAYLADAKSRRIAVDPMMGAELTAFIEQTMQNLSPALIRKLKQSIAP